MSSGDEIDLIVSCLQKKFSIKCQDKQIDLGEAHKFNGKLVTADIDPGILVTTSFVSVEAENFLEGRRGESHIVKGDLGEMRSQILEILNTVIKNEIQERVGMHQRFRFYPRTFLRYR